MDAFGAWSRDYVGGFRPGELSHSLTCEAVSNCRAFRNSSSRSLPTGRDLASARIASRCSGHFSSIASVWDIRAPSGSGGSTTLAVTGNGPGLDGDGNSLRSEFRGCLLGGRRWRLCRPAQHGGGPALFRRSGTRPPGARRARPCPPYRLFNASPTPPGRGRAYPEKINGQDQKAYILSVNNNRWHMSAGQRAMVPTCASSTWMCQQSMRSLYACG